MKAVVRLISNRFVILYIFSLCVLLMGCRSEIKTESAYFEWINNPKNGCVLGKETGSVGLAMKYIHPEYLAYKECVNGVREQYDSLKEVYSQSRTFVFTLRNNDSKGTYDVLYINANSPTEYDRRLRLIQYDMTTSFYIKDKGSEVYPRLCTSENSYGLSIERRIILVFDKNLCPVEKGKIKIYYDDKIFGSGLSEFVFDISNMDSKLRFDFI